MEEKERYSWYNHSAEEIYDNKENIVFVGTITVLNQQNRRIWELIEENKQLKQSQKQLAIEELKLALENFRNRPTHFDVARQELCLSDQDKQFIDFINNRIKELDGGKNDHN